MEKVIVITSSSCSISAATAYFAAEREYVVCVNYLRNQNAAQKAIPYN